MFLGFHIYLMTQAKCSCSAAVVKFNMLLGFGVSDLVQGIRARVLEVLSGLALWLNCKACRSTVGLRVSSVFLRGECRAQPNIYSRCCFAR